MFRKDGSTENRNFQKKVQEDRFLKERMLLENKPHLSYGTAQAVVKTNEHVGTYTLKKDFDGKPNYDSNLIAENKIRQQIRENSPEIRELESKLRLAYTNKLRAVQIAEKNAILERERVCKVEEARLLSEKIAADELQERLKDEQYQKQKMEYKKALDQQVSEQNMKLLSNAYLNFLNEKMLVDEIVEKIIEEDTKRFEMQMIKREEYKSQIEAFKQSQDEQRRKEIKVREEENQRILAYISYKDLEQQEKWQQWQMRKAVTERIHQRLLVVLEDEQKQLDNEKNLRVELSCKEKSREDALKERDLSEQQLRNKIRLRDDLEGQLDYKMNMKALEKEEEKQLAEQMLRELELEHKLEQLSLQKRRLKQMEHRHLVEALIQQRRADKEQSERLERENLLKIQQIQLDRQRIVEEERKKILEEHAVKLLGFLPKGIL